MKGLIQIIPRKIIHYLKTLFISHYRYPFKLVVRPRKLFSDLSHKGDRYSPPGFNNITNEDLSPLKYDLYLEPDGLKKSSYLIMIALSVTIFIISMYSSLKQQQISFFILLEIFIPSLIFILTYFFFHALTSLYYTYPIFSDSWSNNMDSYKDWFLKIPQELIINKRQIVTNKGDKKRISVLMKNSTKKTIDRSRQPLLYSWNSGSAQKGIWLLGIENLIYNWETKSIFKSKTSIIIILSPVWSSYISLLLVLIFTDLYNQHMVKNLYIPAILWLSCSVTYLLSINFFISERKKEEVRTNPNIVSFIPYDLRSTAPRYNNLYSKFNTKHFLSITNILFAGLLVFYISLIGLLK